MPRPRFTLKTLLWLMLVVAAFFGGASWQHRLLRQRIYHLEEEKRFAELQLSLEKWEDHTSFSPHRSFYMDEESWSLVQHAAEMARLDTSVWIKTRLAKAAGKELRRRTPRKD